MEPNIAAQDPMLLKLPFWEKLTEQDKQQAEVLVPGERLSFFSKVLNISEFEVLDTYRAAFGLEVLSAFVAQSNPQECIPIRIIHEYQCLPIELKPQMSETETVPFVTLWPQPAHVDRWIYALLGKYPRWFLTTSSALSAAITDLFGVGFYSLEAEQLDNLEDSLKDTQKLMDEENEDAAIIHFVNEIIQKGVADRATDIHFEPQKNALQIRYRIDGDLVPVQVPERLIRYQAAIISRLKIMSRLNISERRRPQDGRITFRSLGKEMDIRVSTFPTQFGESISLRLLGQGAFQLTLGELGLLSEDEESILPIIQKPHGIILVTGPTGSGKSTTLSAFIRKIRSPERRILTVEDPIENEIQGVNQTQVHPEIGLTFASALRYILRQDPDVIMVGEIRDRETADIAIRASLTGHLVLSTLHTNDAAGALTRLIDMEIEPFLLASSVELVVAQRLVRRLCPHCSKKAELLPGQLEHFLEMMGLESTEVKHADCVKEAVGCDQCNGLGYRGRIAIFEILKVGDSLHRMIVERKSARKMREQAISEGMRTLQRCAWEQIKHGNTTMKAVMRYAQLEGQE